MTAIMILTMSMVVALCIWIVDQIAFSKCFCGLVSRSLNSTIESDFAVATVS